MQAQVNEKGFFKHMTLPYFTELSKTCKGIWSAEVKFYK